MLHYLDDQIKDNEIGCRVACGMYSRREINTGMWLGHLKEGAYLEDLSIDGRILFK
jgi:hypothetical protein